MYVFAPLIFVDCFGNFFFYFFYSCRFYDIWLLTTSESPKHIYLMGRSIFFSFVLFNERPKLSISFFFSFNSYTHVLLSIFLASFCWCLNGLKNRVFVVHNNNERTKKKKHGAHQKLDKNINKIIQLAARTKRTLNERNGGMLSAFTFIYYSGVFGRVRCTWYVLVGHRALAAKALIPTSERRFIGGFSFLFFFVKCHKVRVRDVCLVEL